MTEHDAVPVTPATSVQLVAGVNEPASFEEKLTVPDGVLTVPALVSVTVAVHELATPTATLVGLHSNVAAVVRVVTVTGVVLLLPACLASLE